VELYARVRRAVQVEGMSEREAARQFGIARETVRKMQHYSVPPGYQRKKPVRRPKLGPWVGVIDQILKDDESRPKKQRHTAKRIWDRLKEEHGFTGGYTIVKDYVREARQRQREMFVPLAHPPGDAQADFGEALAVVGGKQSKAHFLCIDLPHSDDCFVIAFPAEQTESFCEGHNQAFAYFGGVPRNIVYDNTKIAVAEILGGGKRKRTQAFTELQSHYLFECRSTKMRWSMGSSVGFDSTAKPRVHSRDYFELVRHEFSEGAV
jgi:transposase